MIFYARSFELNLDDRTMTGAGSRNEHGSDAKADSCRVFQLKMQMSDAFMIFLSR